VTSPHLDDLAGAFRRELRRLKRAERTQVLYGQAIRFFGEWLDAQGRPRTLDQFTRHAVAAWLGELAERVDVETVRTRHRGIRRFGRWLVAEGELERAPTEGLQMPDPTQTMPRVLTDDELAALLRGCQVPRGRAGAYDRRIFDGRRDEVLIRVLGDCGLRVSELAGTTLDDVDVDTEAVRVLGKGNRVRVVPYSASTATAIDRYLRVRSVHPKATRTDRFLLGERGPMSPDGIRWRLEVLGRQAGVDGLHPHALRHTFAHRWLAAGGQERDLMHLAGWRSDAMLAVYARTTAVERAHDAHRRMGLGDRL